MPILTFFRDYWLLIALTGVFMSGYYLRGLQDNLKEYKDTYKISKDFYEYSNNFEEIHAEIDKLYDNIDIKLTYENNYNCIIPASGVRLLTQATR